MITMNTFPTSPPRTLGSSQRGLLHKTFPVDFDTCSGIYCHISCYPLSLSKDWAFYPDLMLCRILFDGFQSNLCTNVFLLTVVADDSRSGGHGVDLAPRSYSTDIRVRAMVMPCLSTGETYICIFVLWSLLASSSMIMLSLDTTTVLEYLQTGTWLCYQNMVRTEGFR